MNIGIFMEVEEHMNLNGLSWSGVNIIKNAFRWLVLFILSLTSRGSNRFYTLDFFVFDI